MSENNEWIELKSDKGKRFYYNKLTKEKTWHKPYEKQEDAEPIIYGLGRILNFTDENKSKELFFKLLAQFKLKETYTWNQCLDLLNSNLIFNSLTNIDRKRLFNEFVGQKKFETEDGMLLKKESYENKIKTEKVDFKLSEKPDKKLKNQMMGLITIDSSYSSICRQLKIENPDKMNIFKNFIDAYRFKYSLEDDFISLLNNLYRNGLIFYKMDFYEFLHSIQNNEIAKYLLFKTENPEELFKNFMEGINSYLEPYLPIIQKHPENANLEDFEINAIKNYFRKEKDEELEEGEVRIDSLDL